MAARVSVVNQENIFIAKIRDSESAGASFCGPERLTIVIKFCRAFRVMIEEAAAAQGFPAILTNADVGGGGVSRFAGSTHCVVIAGQVARAPGSPRQHFLKWDAVFFDVLVYSG
jgi:hypothetical protein